MRLLPCSVLLAVLWLGACASTPKPLGEIEPRPYGLLQHPIIEDTADQLVEAARSSIQARLAPDASERWMIPPIVGTDGAWEASALCFAIASRESRLRPVQPTQSLASVPAVQAWLREQQLATSVWVVEVGGVVRPELKLVICTSERVWRSPVIPVSLPRSECFSWPFLPEENPALARLPVGDAEALVEIEGAVHVQSREGLRRLEWYGRQGELRMERLRGWKQYGRTWITRNLGAAPDRSPGLAILRRDLRLEIRDADLPRGEGELVGWSLSRGGSGMELPLRRASEIEIWGLIATPYGWSLPDTWLVLRRPPQGEAYIEMFAAPLRRIPPVPRGTSPAPPEPVTVLTDFLEPLGLPAFDGRMLETHRVSPVAREGGAVVFRPLYEWLAPLQLRALEAARLPELRTARGRDGVGVVRFSALDEDFPLWRAGSAKKRLAEGDWARWREHRAAPLLGVARLDPDMPPDERRQLARWLAARSPFELFGEERPGLLPLLPLTGELRPEVEPVAQLSLNRSLWLTATSPDSTRVGLPAAWKGEQLQRLSLLLQDAGARIQGVAASADEPAPADAYRIHLTRLHVAGRSLTERMRTLATALDLRAHWNGGLPESEEEIDLAFAREFERWMLDEGWLVPLWNEPGIVFVDRRLMNVRSDSTLLLPDLREARWLPESELRRLRGGS